jgi:hypothetical protein
MTRLTYTLDGMTGSFKVGSDGSVAVQAGRCTEPELNAVDPWLESSWCRRSSLPLDPSRKTGYTTLGTYEVRRTGFSSLCFFVNSNLYRLERMK